MDTDFSLEDKEEDIFSSDIKLITYPQELTDKKEVNLKPHTNRRNTKVTDYIYTMQNGILEKILLKDYSLEDLFSFLMYDLILNHDKSFSKLKNRIKEEIECDTKLQTRIEISFLKEMIQSFRDKETDLFNKLKEFLQKEEAYSNDLLIYSTELCMLIFEFLDIAAQTKCYKVEIEDKKKYNYTNNRKVLFNEVYSLVKPNTVNVKLMGGAVYRECKKLKIGKSNGFTTKYLCVDKEESNLCESTVKRKKQNENLNLNLKKNKQQSHEKIKAIKMPLNFYEDTQNRIIDFKEIKYKTYKISDETFKTNNESKKMTGKNLCGNIFDEKEERIGLCNEEFLHGMLQFNENEDDPDLRYKIVFQDDFDDQHGFISKMEGGEKECSSEETESLSS